MRFKYIKGETQKSEYRVVMEREVEVEEFGERVVGRDEYEHQVRVEGESDQLQVCKAEH